MGALAEILANGSFWVAVLAAGMLARYRVRFDTLRRAR